MIIPTTIMTGDSINYKRRIGIHIGQYCQVNKEDTPFNRNKPRNKGDIYIGPSINMQGFKFMSMRSMEKTTRRYWDMSLISDKLIDLVNILGKYQQQLLVSTDHKGKLIGDGDGNLTGVDGDGDENEAPINIENENHLDYQEEFHTNQEDQTI